MAQDDRVTMFLERNKGFASSYPGAPFLFSQTKAQEPRPPKAIAIISCMDLRLTPWQYLGLNRGEAVVVQNGGGRVSPALKDLMVLDTLTGIETVIIVHHTDCGLTHTTDEQVRAHVNENAPLHSHEIKDMHFGEIKDMAQSVRDDIDVLKSTPYLKIPNILGYVYDIERGTLQEVEP